MSWFGKGGDPAAKGRQSTGPTHPAPNPAGGLPAHSSYTEYETDQYARLSTTPMPYDIESTHEPVIVHATAVETLTLGGPDSGPNPAAVLNEVLQNLGRQASSRGCDGVWSIHHTMTVDAGVLFISAIGTGSRPMGDLDRPPPGSRG